ncbi:hypothetical protein D3C87_1362640 [compost metagenome]
MLVDSTTNRVVDLLEQTVSVLWIRQEAFQSLLSLQNGLNVFQKLNRCHFNAVFVAAVEVKLAWNFPITFTVSNFSYLFSGANEVFIAISQFQLVNITRNVANVSRRSPNSEQRTWIGVNFVEVLIAEQWTVIVI